MSAWAGYKRRRERREREYAIEALFAHGEDGFFYLFDDLELLFQNSAGSTPATADNDPIGRVNDRSPNGVNATQGTAANRPLWKNGNVPYLLGDGTNDALTSTFVPTAAVTIAAAFRCTSVSGADAFIGGGTSTGNHRCFLGTSSTGAPAVGWGSESAVGFGSVDIRGQDHVLLLTGDADTRDLWIDGELLDSRAPSGGPDGTGGGVALLDYNNGGNFGVIPGTGNLYAALAVDRRLTETEIQRTMRILEETIN